MSISDEDRERWPTFAKFVEDRAKDNDTISELNHLGINRFFTLDDRAYKDNGVLDVKTKELMGLSASLVLRCDGCIKYHVATCVRVGLTKEEITECFNIGLVVGGSIVIPHLRAATRFLIECLEIKAEHPEILEF